MRLGIIQLFADASFFHFVSFIAQVVRLKQATVGRNKNIYCILSVFQFFDSKCWGIFIAPSI